MVEICLTCNVPLFYLSGSREIMIIFSEFIGSCCNRISFTHELVQMFSDLFLAAFNKLGSVVVMACIFINLLSWEYAI